MADDEISLGRIGDALIECGKEKEIAVSGFKEIRKILVE